MSVSKRMKLKVSALVLLTLMLSDICCASVQSETNEMNEEKKRQQVIKDLHRFDKNRDMHLDSGELKDAIRHHWDRSRQHTLDEDLRNALDSLPPSGISEMNAFENFLREHNLWNILHTDQRISS